MTPEGVNIRHPDKLFIGGRGGRPRAVVERRARGRDRAVHVLGSSCRRAGDDFLRVRIDDLELAPARRCDPFAADEQLVGVFDVHALGGHCRSP